MAQAGAENGDEAGKGIGRRRQRRRYIPRLSCFRPSAAGDSRAEVVGERRPPTHLVVMVNGIIGSASNWKYAAKQFVKKYPEDVLVHCSECNYNTLTLDGVDVMGKRLAKEILSVVARRPELQKISFIGHSLGGLIARYAISLLYEKGAPKDNSEGNEEYKSHTSESKGKIAGLEPMNFITFATPHLGSRSHKQVPLLLGFYTLEKVAYHTSGILRRSGKHLFLKDNDNGKPPLLLQMATDFEGQPFMSSLKSFKRHVAYSNVYNDLLVGRKTSSIRHQHELPMRQNFMKNEKYPHIVHVEKPKSPMQQREFSEEIAYQLKTASEMEEAMMNSLKTVPWERIDVSFRKSKQRFFAHSTIQVKTYLINSDGADVIYHMIDNFLL